MLYLLRHSLHSGAQSLRRIIRDLPWRGTPVRIRFIARRFFCDCADCGRKLFAEQIDELVDRRGRATRRFDVQLVHLGLEAGGAPGARLARKQGTITSGSTILWRLRAMATSGFTSISYWLVG